MSRRNGRSLAQAFSAVIERLAREEPGRPPVEYWLKALESRRGWHKMGFVQEGEEGQAHSFEFRTGQRLEFDGKKGPEEWLTQVAQVEIASLGKGLPQELQGFLLREAIQEAVAWWRSR